MTPSRYETAPQLWQRLDGQRREVLKRAERYAAYTLPYLLTPEGQMADEEGSAGDWQSVGAQVTNHLVTKLMLALFAPSRPFLRLDASEEVIEQFAAAGVSEEDLTAALGEAERRAVKKLDQLSLRPKLFEVLKHLVVIGNVLMVLDEKRKMMRALNLRHFCVKRDIYGRLHTLVIRERVKFDELSPDVQAMVMRRPADPRDHHVNFYIVVCRQGDRYEVKQWVDEQDLGPAYTKTYSEEKLPYRVLTWNLPDEADYGNSLVGSVEGDFAALSTLSRAMIEGAVAASEYRWLLNPASNMRAEDFERVQNGGVVPGQEGDLVLVNAAQALSGALQVVQSINAEYINRIGRTFLLSSAMTRDAERVTAEEIRLMAQELETGLGGGYSRLAVDLQLPLGLFLLTLIDLRFKDRELVPTVVTGLDALSRNGDLEALSSYLDDVVKLGTLPPQVLEWLVMDAVLTDLATMRGVKAGKYVRKQAQVDAARQQQQAAQVQADVATAAGTAAAQGAMPQ